MSNAEPSAPAQPDREHAELLAEAEAHAQAAVALLLDVAVPVSIALPHLHASWDALRRLGAARSDVVIGDEPPIDAPSDEAERRAWIRRARALVSVVRAADRSVHARDRRAEELRTWKRRVLIGLAILVPVIVLLAIFPPDYREGPWRAQYFYNPKLDGEPEIRRDGDLRFKWEDGAPLHDMPEDGFSARWDTCMAIDEPLTIAFKLVSDDGSRLYIDEGLIVDNWGKHSERSRGGKVELEPGIHHVRVDYFEAKADAMLSLAASLRGERPDSLPTKILHYPGDEIDDEDPCADVRASLR